MWCDVPGIFCFRSLYNKYQEAQRYVVHTRVGYALLIVLHHATMHGSCHHRMHQHCLSCAPPPSTTNGLQVASFEGSDTWLRILSAERSGLVKVDLEFRTHETVGRATRGTLQLVAGVLPVSSHPAATTACWYPWGCCHGESAAL